MNEQEFAQTPLTREMLVPSEWTNNSDGGVVWISCFYAMGLDPKLFSSGAKLIDLQNMRIAILYGSINHLEVIESIRSSVIPQIYSEVNEKQSPEGGYVLLLQQFDPENPSKTEVKIKEQIQIIAGLLAALLGQNIVYKNFLITLLN